MNLKSCADAVCRLYVLIRAMGLLIFRLCLEWPARLSFYKSYDASGYAFSMAISFGILFSTLVLHRA